MIIVLPISLIMVIREKLIIYIYIYIWSQRKINNIIVGNNTIILKLHDLPTAIFGSQSPFLIISISVKEKKLDFVLHNVLEQ